MPEEHGVELDSFLAEWADRCSALVAGDQQALPSELACKKSSAEWFAGGTVGLFFLAHTLVPRRPSHRQANQKL